MPPRPNAQAQSGQVVGIPQDPEVQSGNQALEIARGALERAVERYNNAIAKYDDIRRSGDIDPLVLDAVAKDFQLASSELAKAEESYATNARQLVAAYSSAGARQETDAQKGERQAQAKHLAAQASLADAQALALKSKTPQDKAESEAAIKRATAEANRIAAEISTIFPAQAANLVASAHEAEARVTTLFPAQAAQAQAGAALSSAQAGQVTAETANLLPAQVRNTLAQAGYTEAQIRSIEQGLKRPVQVTQGLDQPKLAFMNPETGLVTGQPNPAYTNQTAQLLQNQYDALDTIQGMIEKRQLSPAEAQTYMDTIRAQTKSALRGTTPYQEQQEANRYRETSAGIGRDILNNRTAQGASLASSLTNSMITTAQGMTRPYDFAGFNPFQMASGFVNQMGGGQQVGDTASQLVMGLQGGSNMAPDGLPNYPPGTHVVTVPGPSGTQQAVAQQPAPQAPMVRPGYMSMDRRG